MTGGRSDLLAVNPERFTAAQLRAAAKGEVEIAGLTPELAVTLLREKNEPGVVQDLAALLHDEMLPERVRAVAAIELGRTASEEATATLRRVPAGAPALVRRGVERALAAGPSPPSALAARLERGESFSFPERLLSQAATGRGALVFGTVERAQIERAARSLRQPASESLDLERAVTVECAGQEYVFLPRSDAGIGDAAQLLARPSVLGHVAIRHHEEVDSWQHRFDVVSQPGAEPDTVDVVIATSTGAPVYAGHLRAGADGTLLFEVATAAESGQGPTWVTGRLDREGVHVDQGLTGPARSVLPVDELPSGESEEQSDGSGAPSH